jgi:L-2-hydroxyglutarate oxidase LhgO
MTAAWDVVVIGAGVVGLACAERLARGGRAVLVIERHARPGQETSSRSSQVVHAGMYYAEGTRKAELCVRGNASLGAYCEAHHVPLSRVGKLIVATDEAGEAELATILARGRSNGCAELGYASRAELAREPNVVARAALWSPRTGIVDSHALVQSLATGARDHGADLALAHTLRAVAHGDGGYELRVDGPSGDAHTLTAPSVVNAAGLDADAVAAMAGLDVDALGYRQRYVKGSYFRLRRPLVSKLVYPVPPRSLAGLGVHVTVELDGSARLGPDVEPLEGRAQDYRVDEARAPAFLAAARTYLRGLELDDLSPDQAGIRPKLSRPGEPARDFVIAEESARGLPRWVSLVGIESPGLTCCLEIADRVARLLDA